jgi:hypothetical protein
MVNNSTNIKKKKKKHTSHFKPLNTVQTTAYIYIYIVMEMQ